MLNLIGLSLALLLQLNAGMDAKQQFAKYPKIEAYEIRPDILMLPRYTADGEVCALGLQRLHYSPEMIRVDSDMTGEGIDKILDELAPAAERGKPSEVVPRGLYTRSGQSMFYSIDYEYIDIQY